MLNKVRKVLPLIGVGESREALQAERDKVQVDLDQAYADLDGLRAEFREHSEEDTRSPPVYVKLNARLAELEAHKDALRKRRRELDELLAPPPLPPLVNVPKSADLIKVEAALEAARTRREQCLRDTFAAFAAKKELTAERCIREREAAEDDISALRMQRRGLEEEYGVVVAEALAPMVKAAAEKLLAAVKDAEPAIDLLSRAAAMSLSQVAGLPNPLRVHAGGDNIGNIPFRMLADFARNLGAGQERG